MYAKVDLVELCSSLTQRRLEQWIDHGWITPHTQTAEKAFTDLDRTRADLIGYLLDELEIQEDAMPVILSLLDQVYTLRSELRGLVTAVASQPPAIQYEITAALRGRGDQARSTAKDS